MDCNEFNQSLEELNTRYDEFINHVDTSIESGVGKQATIMVERELFKKKLMKF